MSRIGKQSITIPKGLEVAVQGSKIIFKSPKSFLQVTRLLILVTLSSHRCRPFDKQIVSNFTDYFSQGRAFLLPRSLGR